MHVHFRKMPDLSFSIQGIAMNHILSLQSDNEENLTHDPYEFVYQNLPRRHTLLNVPPLWSKEIPV